MVRVAFKNVDLALNGNCAVSKVANRRDVPGSADFTVVHKGIRFQFVSAEHKAAFEAEPGKYEDAGKPLLALNGHCVVCLRDGNEWVKGTEEFATVHDGREYRFPGAPQRDAFLAAPNNYVPVLGGDCVVCLAKKGERVAGSIFHATYFRDRLYLFPSLEIKQQFKAAPESYERRRGIEWELCSLLGQRGQAGGGQYGISIRLPRSAVLLSLGHRVE